MPPPGLPAPPPTAGAAATPGRCPNPRRPASSKCRSRRARTRAASRCCQPPRKRNGRDAIDAPKPGQSRSREEKPELPTSPTLHGATTTPRRHTQLGRRPPPASRTAGPKPDPAGSDQELTRRPPPAQPPRHTRVAGRDCATTVVDVPRARRRVGRPRASPPPLFKEISAAYEVLSDKEKRSLYDQFGETGLHEDYGGGNFSAHGVDPYELFNAFFGSSNKFFGDSMGPGRFHYSSNVKDSRGLDIRYDLLLPFEESILGGKREIGISRYETCGTCHGSGAKSSNSIIECTQCRGQGRSMKSQRTPFGIVSQISSCLNCNGSGKIITEHCPSCDGSGKVQVERTIQVDIPGGIEDGSAIRITGGGSVDKQRGVSGDLYIFVRVEEKQGIHREGLNLCSDVTIDCTDAILGTTVKVETIEGLKDLHIPPGTQPGEELKFAQLGAPDIKRPNHRGDHNFVINVKIPRNISDQARSLVEDLAALKGAQGISVPSDETIDQGNLRDGSHHSSARKKPSFWGSVRNLFRGDEGDQRFASISAQSVIPRWTYQRGIHPATPLLEGCFMIAALIFVISRRGKFRLYPKGDDRTTKPEDGE